MEKSFLLVVAIYLAVGSPTLATDPCSFLHNGANLPAPIPLPKLPTRSFKTAIRAQFLNSKTTVSAYEYVSEAENVATIKLTADGNQSMVIMNYNTNEVYNIVPNSVSGFSAEGPMSCIAMNLTGNDNTQLFGFGAASSVSGNGGMPHMFSTSQILSFINGSETYRGQSTVSGTPVNQWSRCMYWGGKMDANFTLNYYFTKPGWQTPSGLDQVPVRAEAIGFRTFSNGTEVQFNHVYDYINFENYNNDPESVFNTPPGVYCMFRKKTRSPPALNPQFYYREEISKTGLTNGNYPILSETEVWYDYNLQLVRLDSRDIPYDVSTDLSLSRGPFTTVHNYDIGVQYVIAKDTKQCSIDPIPANAKGFDAVFNITRKTLGMRNPLQFFNLDAKTYLYAGKRTARAQSCDVFQAVINNIAGSGLIVYEVYFLSETVTDIPDRGSGDTPTRKAVPMRILIWQAGKLSKQYEIHDFDQYTEDTNVFDVSPCYEGQKSIDFEMTLNVKDTAQMPIMAPYVQKMLIVSTAMSAGITTLRLQRTRLHWDKAYVYFEGTLLGTAPSAAKYEVTKKTTMTGISTEPVPNVFYVDECAAMCDQKPAWHCTQFDYCPKSQVCTLAKPPLTSMKLVTGNQSCNHYQSVLGIKFFQQATIDKVWQNLRNRVYGNEISLSLKLPDANGHVDVSVDATKLDDTQKITLTAFQITDEVLTDASRDVSLANVMTQFKVVRKMTGKGFTNMIPGVSVDDCATNCVNEYTYNCQSFHYCWGKGACYTSKLHPDERPRMLKPDPNCDLYFRDYTSNFDKFAGLTVLSASDTIYQNVLTSSQCAKLCMYYSGFHCESFDMCTDTNTCYLGTTHYYDAEAAQIKQTPSCAHFSRSYIQDFVVKAKKQVQMRNNRVIQGVSPQQCAKLCVQEGTFSCNSFDYCGNFTECRLSDATVSNTGQVTLEATAYCDVYARQYGSSGRSAAQTGSNKSNGKYSPGAMAGLGIAMIVVGLVLSLVVITLYGKLTGRSPNDGMAIAFSKHEDTSES